MNRTPAQPLRIRSASSARGWCSMLLASAGMAMSLHAAPPSGAGWNLAWNDEFNGTTMDTTKWRHWLLGARRDAMNSPSAVSVANGALSISTYTSGGIHYTGMISTQDTYPYTYGYIEARIDYDSNPGMWSAFWMQSPTMGNPIGSPNVAGTEIDICEHRKVDGSNVNRDGNIGGVIHWDGYGVDHKSHGYDSGNLGLGTGYHIYGMEWTPSQQKFYIDGVLRWTINNAANTPVSQRSEFIILSSEVEDGGWSSTVPAGGYGTLATTTTKMVVDYVRVYRRAETVVNGDFEGKIGPFSATANETTWSSTGGNYNPAAAKLAPTTSAGATVSQGVRGLLPDTGYTISAWGNAGTTAPSLAIGANNHGNAQVSQTLTASSYTKGTAPFTTGSTNRTATVFAKSNNSGSLAYADDFLLRRHATVNNGQLENGESDAWNSTYGGATVSADSAYDGEYAWRFPANASAGAEQEIVGLAPGTAYRLSGWTTNGNTGLTFGVKNHGGSQVTSSVSSNAWTRATVNFTTGSSNTSATVFAFRSSGAQTAYADSFFLYQPLATPWTSQDVSSSGLSGIAGRLDGKFVLQGGGNNIGGEADQMHFLHQPITGDATITARILGVDTAAYHAKTGVMIRESTAPGARSASVYWGPVNQLVEFNRRGTTDAASIWTLTPRDIIDPPWLRLTRRGNVFTAYRSPDGLAWTRVGSPQSISMAASALIGIPACSGDTERLAEAALDNVTVSLPVPDVLITSPAEGTTHTNNGASLGLTATITDAGTPAIAWSMVSGPGTVTFANASLAATSVTFSAPGTYVLRCSAATTAGTGSDDLAVNVAAPALVDPSLVLRLKFDESTGTTATDSSGNNLHGTTSGGLAWQPAGGVLSGAAAFNGTDSHITVPDSPLLDNTSAFTLSFWFKANTLIKDTGLIAKRVSYNDNNSYGIFLSVDGRLNVDIASNNDRFTSTAAINPGAWNHVGLVFDGSLASSQRAKLYLNGALNTTAEETSASLPNYNAPLCIGALNPGLVVLDGLIDEVRFHRRALSAAEISAIHDETGTHAPEVSAGDAPAATILIPAVLTGIAMAQTGPSPATVWTRVSGPGNAAFANAASPSTTVTFDQPGTHVLRLTAANANAEAFADLTVEATLPQPVVTILAPPAPVSLANAADVLRLTASASANGMPDAPVIMWSKLSGPGNVAFADAAALDTTAAFSAPGSYVLRCTATTSAGSASANVGVAVAAPATLALREGEDGYNHSATFIRADSTAWNSGARDQFLAGKKSGGHPFRVLFSYPLDGIPGNATLNSISLDLWTDSIAGIGTVGPLELRDLGATPVEGTGSSASDSADGAGTGATWIMRTGAIPWTAAGGDFGSTVLSSVPGFPATETNSKKTFASSSAFLAALLAARSASQPLNLALVSPLSESGAGDLFTRISSDDSPLVSKRPLLTIGWAAAAAPVIDPGPPPSAVNGRPASLTGAATGATSVVWSRVSGPGNAVFENSALAATTVTFDQAGVYVLKFTAANPNGGVSRNLTVNAAGNPGIFTDWQQLTWPGVSDPEITGSGKDPDHDGLANLLEWALLLDASRPDAFLPAIVLNVSSLELTYTRRRTAPGEALYQVEWSDTLGPGWSASGVVEETLSQTEDSETVRATLPAGNLGKRFVRVRVVRP